MSLDLLSASTDTGAYQGSFLTVPTRHRWSFLRAHQAWAAASLALVAWGPPVRGQDTSPVRARAPRPTSYGVEIALKSGHADRGYLISDRPVLQPVIWLSAIGADFSAWGNFTLGETAEGSLPRILELELTREFEWGNIAIEPAVRMWFYRDPLSPYSSRSLEGWLYLSYHVGPVRLFAHHSLDVLTYNGAYFGDAGIESEGHVSQRIEIGGSLGAGWASATFNDSYFGVAQSALNRLRAEGWLTVYATPRLYVGPHFEFNATLDPRVRAEHIRPTYLLVGITVGGEF